MFDAVIVGAGPAALTLRRVHRTVLLLDNGQGRNAPAGHVHDFLTRDGTPPARLREPGRAEPADELPGPRGVRAPWGRSPFRCPCCHGHECTGKHVTVIGADQARVRLCADFDLPNPFARERG
ncbi:hypothetical protein AB0L65_42945 [Nonomuraea sp. NPDC052116]|uniref:hypothetical protein n=1 Tax=Nonomuraea sp. NPDC052116 TaxID=3155665 RepID=UPI00342989AC